MATNEEKTDEEMMKDLELDPDDIDQNDSPLYRNNEEDININENIDELNISSNADEIALDNNEDEDLLHQEDNEDNEMKDFELEEVEEEGKSTSSMQTKQSKLKRILMMVITGLITVIFLGFIMFLLGVFDEEEVKVKETKMPVKKELVKKSFKFKEKDIDLNRLNKKLNLLTKYEIIENDEQAKSSVKEKKEFEQQSKEEKDEERQEKINTIKEQENLKIKEMIEAAKEEARAELIAEQFKTREANLKEEAKEQENINMLPKKEEKLDDLEKQVQVVKNIDDEKILKKEDTSKEQIRAEENTSIVEKHKEDTSKEQIRAEENTSIVEKHKEDTIQNEEISKETKSKEFVKFISIETKKKNIYKSFLNKIEKIDNNITLCRNNKNQIEVLIGPFLENENRDMVLDTFIQNDISALAIDFTQEEFEKRCEY